MRDALGLPTWCVWHMYVCTGACESVRYPRAYIALVRQRGKPMMFSEILRVRWQTSAHHRLGGEIGKARIRVCYWTREQGHINNIFGGTADRFPAALFYTLREIWRQQLKALVPSLRESIYNVTFWIKHVSKIIAFITALVTDFLNGWMCNDSGQFLIPFLKHRGINSMVS